MDSKLFNYFHYNPWSTPKENQMRAAARSYQRDPLLYRWMVSHAHNHPHGPEDFEQTQALLGAGHEAQRVSDGKEHSHWHTHNHVHDHDHDHDHGDGHHHHHHD